jgi:4-hydroxybenzoate polyprenyltransferase and related prenyltransferases
MATADADTEGEPDAEVDTATDAASHSASDGASEGGDLRAKAAYLFKLSRPRFWLYLAGPVVVGVTYAASSPAELFTPATLALFAYFLLPANVYLYGVNDIFDQDVDEDNPKKDDREVRFQGQRFVVAAVVLLGLGIAALVPLLPAAAYPWLGAYLLLATEYSAPPLRFKTTPFLDSVSNGLYVLPGVAAFTAVAGSAPPLVAVVGGWLWTMAMHTFSAIPDIEPDREAGIDTTATVLGQDRTYAYCGLLWVLAAAAFWVIDFRLGVAMLLYPAFLSAIALSGVDVDRAYWWYPALNTVVGALLTMGKLWMITDV